MKRPAPTTQLATAGVTVLAPVSWGTTYVVVTELLPDGRPLLVAALRVLPAGLLLATVGGLLTRWRPRGRDWITVVSISLCNFGIFFPLLIVGVYRLPGGVAAAMGGIQPILVALVTAVALKQRPKRRDLLVGVVAAFGVSLVVLRPGAGIDPIGVLAAFGANISFSVGVVLAKRLPRLGSPIAATGWELLVAGAVIVPLALVVEGPPPALTSTNLVGFAYLSLVATGLAYVLWFRGIRRLPTQAPPLLGLAAPLTGAAMGWLILDQSLSPVQITGLAITIASIAYGATMRADQVGAMSSTSNPSRSSR